MLRTAIKRTPLRRRKPDEKARDLAQAQPESKFQAQVEELAHALGYMTSHAHLPYFDTAGMPDLLIVHPRTGRTIFAELKVMNAKGHRPSPSPAQMRWLSALAMRNETYVFCWPWDWDELVAVLKGEAP